MTTPVRPKIKLPTRDPLQPIMISLSEYKGELRLDIRQYWTPDGEEEPVPSKKGVSIPVAQAPKVVEAIQKVIAASEKEKKNGAPKAPRSSTKA